MLFSWFRKTREQVENAKPSGSQRFNYLEALDVANCDALEVFEESEPSMEKSNILAAARAELKRHGTSSAERHIKRIDKVMESDHRKMLLQIRLGTERQAWEGYQEFRDQPISSDDLNFEHAAGNFGASFPRQAILWSDQEGLLKDVDHNVVVQGALKRGRFRTIAEKDFAQRFGALVRRHRKNHSLTQTLGKRRLGLLAWARRRTSENAVERVQQRQRKQFHQRVERTIVNLAMDQEIEKLKLDLEIEKLLQELSKLRKAASEVRQERAKSLLDEPKPQP